MADTGRANDTAGSRAPTLSSKCKAQQISPDDDALHLPAPVWGRVLDFMPYTEVRSVLLVGKHIAVETAKYVSALNIMKESEMFIPAARRFANVEEVNILCLLGHTGETDGGPYTISLGVANRIVPFMSSFARLTRGFVGGMAENAILFSRYAYDAVACGGPSNHQDVFRSLLSAYVGAVKTGLLSQQIALDGMVQGLYTIDLCEERTPDCYWCRGILMHLPIKSLLRYLTSSARSFSPPEGICISTDDAWGIVRRRADFSQGLKDTSNDVLCFAIKRYTSVLNIDRQSRVIAVKQLPQKWRAEERKSRDTCAWFMNRSSIRELDYLIEKGFDPSLVSREHALDYLSNVIGNDGDTFHFWTKSTIENLVRRGFPVDCDCMPVVDDQYCTNSIC